MKSSDKIIALIPAYNEQEYIAEVILSTTKYLPVLVLDDGSTDDTAAIAASTGARVISQSPNRGKGTALQRGLSVCYQEGYQAVLTLDGDGQHDPEEIPKFLESYRNKQAQLIIGQRDYRQMPLRRRIPNTLGKLLLSWAAGQSIPDNQSGYRLIDRSIIPILLDHSEEGGFEFEVDMILLAIKHNLEMKWIPIKTIYRDEHSYIRPLRHLINYLRMTKKAYKMIHS